MTIVYNGKDISFIRIKLVDDDDIYYDDSSSTSIISIQHYTDTLRIKFEKNERIIKNDFINDLEFQYK